MIDKKEVLEIHRILIEQFGDTQGVKEESLLESVLEKGQENESSVSVLLHDLR